MACLISLVTKLFATALLTTCCSKHVMPNCLFLDVTDVTVFRCNRCDTKTSVRANSWFSQFSCCSFNAIFRSILHWTSRCDLSSTVCVEAGISQPTLRKICNQLDVIVCNRLSTFSEKLGGLGKYVVIDESFALKPKVRSLIIRKKT